MNPNHDAFWSDSYNNVRDNRFQRVLEEAVKLAGLCEDSFLTRPYIAKIIEIRCFKYDWVEYYIPTHVNNNGEVTVETH
jgi:hypothetical protein